MKWYVMSKHLQIWTDNFAWRMWGIYCKEDRIDIYLGHFNIALTKYY